MGSRRRRLPGRGRGEVTKSVYVVVIAGVWCTQMGSDRAWGRPRIWTKRGGRGDGVWELGGGIQGVTRSRKELPLGQTEIPCGKGSTRSWKELPLSPTEISWGHRGTR